MTDFYIRHLWYWIMHDTLVVYSFCLMLRVIIIYLKYFRSFDWLRAEGDIALSAW